VKTFMTALLLVAATQLAPLNPAQAAEGSPVVERGAPEARQEVVQAIDAWRAAVVAKNRVGLEQAYHEDLSYGHTDGAVLTKAEQIDRTLAPDRDFTAVDATEVAVRVYGDVAYVTAGYAFHVQTKGQPARIAKLAGLDVWTKAGGQWRLIARQLTKLES